jgi:hypothetical protein
MEKQQNVNDRQNGNQKMKQRKNVTERQNRNQKMN